MTDKELVEKFEGLRLHAYPDPAGQTKHYAVGWGYNSPEITKDTVWTLQQADAKLDLKLNEARACVATAVTVPLTDNQRAALVSLCYNIGTGYFVGSTLVSLLNKGDSEGASAQFLVWDHVHGKVDNNLLARRKLEKAIFLSSSTNLSDVQPQVDETQPVGPATVPVRVGVGVKGGAMVSNIWQHPVTTILGVIGGAFLATAHYTNWHDFGAAFALALLGALAKEK